MVSRDVTELELMALKATVLPILMRDSKQVMSQVIRTALRGIFQPGLTCWSSYQYFGVGHTVMDKLTCAMKLWKGSALSRANDQV